VPPATNSAPVLELLDVTARYGAGLPAAVQCVTLRVGAGEIVALVGANGAGKSSLLRVLSGALAAEAGEVRVLGEPMAAMERQAVARHVAMVAQSEQVRLGFSVTEVVMMGRAPHQGSWMRPSDEDHRLVAEAIRRCDLEHVACRDVTRLSGGELKRVAIARALAQGGEVLLLDEPTAFLDVRHQVGLLAEVRRVAQDERKACVFVTHDLQLAAAVATRAVLLKGGRVVAEGGVDSVLTADCLAEVFDWPIEVDQAARVGARVFIPSGLNAATFRPKAS
jgi:iron complex transport system ATP-binding protein